MSKKQKYSQRHALGISLLKLAVGVAKNGSVLSAKRQPRLTEIRQAVMKNKAGAKCPCLVKSTGYAGGESLSL